MQAEIDPLNALEAAERPSGAINARSHGAVGDGVQDDTEALQSALDDAALSGQTVFLPAGRYLCSTLRLPPRAILRGEQGWGYRHVGGAVLEPCGGDAVCLLDLSGAKGAVLEGLCLVGRPRGSGPRHGVFLANARQGVPHRSEDGLRIEHCRITGFPGDGIHLQRVWVFHVCHCLVDHNGGDGLHVRGCDGTLATNSLTGNGGAGFRSDTWTRAIHLSSNRIEWNRDGGVDFTYGASYQIVGNFFDRATGPALCARLPAGATEELAAEYVTISGNLIRRSGTHRADDSSSENAHVRLERVRGVVLCGNVLVAGVDDLGEGTMSPAHAFVLRGLQDAVISGNALANGATRTLFLDHGGHGQGVVIRDNPGDPASGVVVV